MSVIPSSIARRHISSVMSQDFEPSSRPGEYGNEYQSLIPEWGDEAGVSINCIHTIKFRDAVVPQ